MKSLKWLLILSFLIAPFTLAATKNVYAEGIDAAGYATAANKLVLTMGSAKMVHNGTTYLSAQPVANIEGRTFIPFSSIAKRYGYTISYDAQKKESIARNDKHELVFKIGSGFAYRDGVLTKLTARTFRTAISWFRFVRGARWRTARSRRTARRSR